MEADAQGTETQQHQQPFPEMEATLRDFLMEHADPEAEFSCKLFRSYRPPGTHQEKCSYLTSFRGTVPTYDDIRALVGPGTYRLNLIYTDKKGKRTATGRILEIDPDPMQPQVPAVVGMAGQPAQGLGPAQMVELLTAMMRTIADIAKAGNGRSAGADMSAITESFAKSIGTMATAQIGVVTDLQRRAFDLPDTEQKIERPEGIVDFLVWAWNTFGAKLMKSPALGKLAAPQVRTMPQVEYLMENPEDYLAVVQEFTQETGIERGPLDKLLHALALPTPEQLLAQMQQPAESAGAGAAEQPPPQ